MADDNRHIESPKITAPLTGDRGFESISLSEESATNQDVDDLALISRASGFAGANCSVPRCCQGARRFRFWLPCALREATATMMIVGREVMLGRRRGSGRALQQQKLAPDAH